MTSHRSPKDALECDDLSPLWLSNRCAVSRSPRSGNESKDRAGDATPQGTSRKKESGDKSPQSKGPLAKALAAGRAFATASGLLVGAAEVLSEIAPTVLAVRIVQMVGGTRVAAYVHGLGAQVDAGRHADWPWFIVGFFEWHVCELQARLP